LSVRAKSSVPLRPSEIVPDDQMPPVVPALPILSVPAETEVDPV
jgi:hypothetical protein